MKTALHRPGGVLLAGTLVASVFASMPAAHAADTGSITGQVTDEADVPVPLVDIDVAALVEVPNGPDDSYWSAVAYGSTDEFGNYSIGELPAGTYRVEFGDRLNPNPYASEFYNDQATVAMAQDIEVGAVAVPDIDAQLAPESTISGTVTGASDEALSGALVLVYGEANGAWDYLDEITTNSAGQYTLNHLPQGTYRVEFEFETADGDYLSEAYNNKRYLSGGDNIPVGRDADVAGINAKLIAGEHTPPPFTMTALPVISGTPQVGSTLTVTSGSWTPTPDETYHYWFRGETFIEGAVGTTYVPTAADVGQTLSVFVQVYGEERYDSANTGPFGPIAAVPVPVVTAPTPAPAAPAPAPVITFSNNIDVKGALKVGSVLKLKNFKALVAGATVTPKLQWFAGTKKIKKATKPKLMLTKVMKGKKISVKVTAKVGTTTKTVKVKVGKVR